MKEIVKISKEHKFKNQTQSIGFQAVYNGTPKP
jgi:hypothetical protein